MSKKALFLDKIRRNRGDSLGAVKGLVMGLGPGRSAGGRRPVGPRLSPSPPGLQETLAPPPGLKLSPRNGGVSVHFILLETFLNTSTPDAGTRVRAGAGGQAGMSMTW